MVDTRLLNNIEGEYSIGINLLDKQHVEAATGVRTARDTTNHFPYLERKKNCFSPKISIVII